MNKRTKVFKKCMPGESSPKVCQYCILLKPFCGTGFIKYQKPKLIKKYFTG